MTTIEVTDRELAAITWMRMSPAERLAANLAKMTAEERKEYDRRNAMTPLERKADHFQRMAATAEQELAKPELAAVVTEMAAKAAKAAPPEGEAL